MGVLVNGKWYENEKEVKDELERHQKKFQNWITNDGSAGPSGNEGFKAEAGRYHLYVAYTCPFSHRTLAMRKLKKLEGVVSVSVVDYEMGKNGWEFKNREGSTGDNLYNFQYLYELYLKADPNYTGKVSVPVLWDKEKETIVSDESADIMRMFNSAFDSITGSTVDYYPEDLRSEIDDLNKLINSNVNSGVFKAGLAKSQNDYEGAVTSLFETLDMLDERLRKNRYLLGDTMTEADWRLFPTLIRFDPVYYGLFKCNIRRIEDYASLFPYLRDLYQQHGIAKTVNMLHIKNGYYLGAGFKDANPNRIVPIGPKMHLEKPHSRDRITTHAKAAES